MKNEGNEKILVIHQWQTAVKDKDRKVRLVEYDMGGLGMKNVIFLQKLKINKQKVSD